MAAKINLGKLSDKQLKALKHRIENELKTSRTRAVAAATQELQVAVQRIARKRGLTVSEVLGKKKAAYVTCAGEVPEPGLSEPDQVRTWTQAGVVQGCNEKGRIGRAPRSLNSGNDRHVLPAVSHRN